jgi:hypothetical protein
MHNQEHRLIIRKSFDKSNATNSMLGQLCMKVSESYEKENPNLKLLCSQRLQQHHIEGHGTNEIKLLIKVCVRLKGDK